ncbi:MAG: hypothetical protein JNM43_28325 [Planctomycetaceae bacterium]|nr:hypothetical protein [Planctomycetaceae bacterium]
MSNSNEHNGNEPWHPARLVGRSSENSSVRMLIDTSTLMHTSFPDVCKRDLIPWAGKLLQQSSIGVLAVPQEVLRELETMSELDSPPDNPRRKEMAVQAVTQLSRLHQQGIVRLTAIGHASANQAADDVFGPLIMQLLLEYDVILLTQDRALADLCSQQYAVMLSSPAYSGRKRRFCACRIHKARMIRHDSADDHVKGNYARAKLDSKPEESADFPEDVATELRELDDTLVMSHSHPAKPDAVVHTATGQVLTLSGPAMSGGEGTVLHVKEDASVVAKIYHPNHMRLWRFDKLRKMVARAIRNRAVAWPSDLIQDQQGVPVGFLMPRVDGAVPLKDSLCSPAMLSETFPAWTRRHLVLLARNLAHVIGILHDRGEVIGDLNPANVLVLEEGGEPRVKLVDCDSWQFNGYPSPVGVPEYTPPEIARQSFSTFLRSQDHDRFALAILLFEILFVGRHPYSGKGDLTIAEAMEERAFPYPLGRHDEEDREKTPKGQPFRTWTHLPWKLQEAFHGTFRLGKIYSAAEWSERLHGYFLDIENGRLDAIGNADAIQPQAVRVPVRRADGVSAVVECQEPGCNSKEEYFGAEVIERKKSMRFFRCRKCAEKYRMESLPGQSRLCSHCEEVFSLPVWFERMLKENGVQIPDLCPQHGGLTPHFECHTCDWKWTESYFFEWNQTRSSIPVRCKRCVNTMRKSYRCAACSQNFTATGAATRMLDSIPTHQIYCFRCKEIRSKQTPTLSRPIHNPPAPRQTQPGTMEPPVQKPASSNNQAMKTPPPPQPRSLLRRIWDALSSL